MTIKEVSEKYHIAQTTLRYYEKVGIIPRVNRTQGGIRKYNEEDIRWIEQAICMRDAGLSVAATIEYVRLFQIGDETVLQRVELLEQQKRKLLERKKEVDESLERLNAQIELCSILG